MYNKVASIGDFRTVLCELVHEKFYHLDTCFCPLDDKVALYYPPAFSAETIQRMSEHIKLVPVTEDQVRSLVIAFLIAELQANKFVCNAIPANGTVIFPSGCEPTMDVVKKLGFRAVSVDMSEFMKSGGACQCLVLKLPD